MVAVEFREDFPGLLKGLQRLGGLAGPGVTVPYVHGSRAQVALERGVGVGQPLPDFQGPSIKLQFLRLLSPVARPVGEVGVGPCEAALDVEFSRLSSGK